MLQQDFIILCMGEYRTSVACAKVWCNILKNSSKTRLSLGYCSNTLSVDSHKVAYCSHSAELFTEQKLDQVTH